MKGSTQTRNALTWLAFVPPARWLAEYRAAWLPADAVAGVTLAAYAIPVSLAYAGLAGLPPQVGVYGYLLGGLGYALLGSSRQLAIGHTSAISLMIAGTVGAIANRVHVGTEIAPRLTVLGEIPRGLPVRRDWRERRQKAGRVREQTAQFVRRISSGCGPSGRRRPLVPRTHPRIRRRS